MHKLRGRQFDPEVIDAFDRLDSLELVDRRRDTTRSPTDLYAAV
jgi:hypothetical protein